jgi:type I restriction enzyme, R subunit
MSEYTFVEKPFLDQLEALGWTVIDQVIESGPGIPTDPTKSLRASFREVTLRDEFNQSVRAINTTADGRTWLTDKQLDDLHDALLGHSGRSLVENNEAVLKLLFRSPVVSVHQHQWVDWRRGVESRCRFW